MNNVIPIRPHSRLTVIQLQGDEYPGAQAGTYAIFGPLRADAPYPVLALVNHEHDLSVERGTPVYEGVRLADGTLLPDAVMLGLLAATAGTRELAAVAIAHLKTETARLCA